MSGQVIHIEFYKPIFPHWIFLKLTETTKIRFTAALNHKILQTFLMQFWKTKIHIVLYVAGFICFINCIFIIETALPPPPSHISCKAFPTPSLLCSNTVIHFQRGGE